MAIPVNVPLAVRTAGGPFDIILGVEDEYMGFRTAGPADRRQVSNLAETISIGGEAAYSNDAYSQLIVNGFDEGGDRELFESGDRRYYTTDGKASLAVKNVMSMASAWEISDAAHTATAREMIDFNGSLCPQPWLVYACGTTLRAYNTTTGVWADAHPAAGAFANPITSIRVFDNTMLAICFGSAANWQGWTGASLTTTFIDTGIKSDVVIPGTILSVLYWHALAGSLYKYTGGAWSAAIPVGFSNLSITDLLEHQGLLFVAKPEGLFTYDGTTVRRILSSDNSLSTNNFRGFGEWLGALYLPWKSALHKGVVSSSVSIASTDITPLMTGDTAKETYGHGIPIKCIAGPRRIYVAFNAGEGTYPEVLAYDGVGFQQVYRGTAADVMVAMGYSVHMGWLMINSGGATLIKRLVDTCDAEYPNFNATSQTESPFFDGGKPGELKAWRSIQIDAQDCSATNYINIYYRTTRDATWTLVGALTSDGQQELLFDPGKGHVASRKLQFRIELIRGGAVTTTPKLRFPIIIRVMISSLAKDAYYETIILAPDEALNNNKGVISDTGYSQLLMKTFLDKVRNSPYPITRIDEEGEIMAVKVTDKGGVGDRPDMGTSPVRWNFALRWLDTRPGNFRQTDNHRLVISVGTITTNKFTWATFSAFGIGAIGLSYCEG
jgi:hypothetical protein